MLRKTLAIAVCGFGLALAGPAGGAETEDAGPLMVGNSTNGGILCSAKNSTDAPQTISIVATSATGAVLGTAGPVAVAANAELQLPLAFFIVRNQSVTCRSEGETVISSSISIKSTQGEAIESVHGENLL